MRRQRLYEFAREWRKRRWMRWGGRWATRRIIAGCGRRSSTTLVGSEIQVMLCPERLAQTPWLFAMFWNSARLPAFLGSHYRGRGGSTTSYRPGPLPLPLHCGRQFLSTFIVVLQRAIPDVAVADASAMILQLE